MDLISNPRQAVIPPREGASHSSKKLSPYPENLVSREYYHFKKGEYDSERGPGGEVEKISPE